MPTLEQIMAWAKDNQLMLGLVGSAIVGAMPEKLPKLREFPQWVWTWFRDTAKTFLNLRHGKGWSQESIDPAGKIEKKDPVVEKKDEKKDDKKNESKTMKMADPVQLNG